jgi:hypothetical protein
VRAGQKVQESTYDTVRALGALAVDTTSAAAGVVCARVHGGGSGSCAEMQKARGAGEDQDRRMIAEKRDGVESFKGQKYEVSRR